MMMGKKKLFGETSNPRIILPKVYVKPKLILLGDVRGVTLGCSAGLGESGAPGTRHNPVPPETCSSGKTISLQNPNSNPFDIQP
jgi:hypothetical protein